MLLSTQDALLTTRVHLMVGLRAWKGLPADGLARFQFLEVRSHREPNSQGFQSIFFKVDPFSKMLGEPPHQCQVIVNCAMSSETFSPVGTLRHWGWTNVGRNPHQLRHVTAISRGNECYMIHHEYHEYHESVGEVTI